MSGQSSKWREDQILILCPGSRTTMAQLGCNELTPPAYRIPTRMFRDEDTDEWRPYRTWKRKKVGAGIGDAAVAVAAVASGKEEDEWEFVEDPDSDEGAVYPMEGGYITNMEAFLAFLEHVHGLLTTTYHNTPIVLMASPQWTRPDCEAVALYIFEKTRTPALCMINSALATQYGLKWPHMTVIDIGFEKVDVTCIYDSRIVNHMDVGYPAEPGEDRAISGGEVFTQRLKALLRSQDFTYEMAEQLKKSPVCEVLPYSPDQPLLMELPKEDAAPAATVAASEPLAAPVSAPAPAAEAETETGTTEASASAPPPSASQPAAAAPSAPSAPSAPIAAADIEVEMDDAVENDGVLDVAQIVTSGQTREFLAKKEKEKSERGRPGRRAKDKEAEAAAAKPVRLVNAKRARAIFHYEELVEDNEPEKPAAEKAAEDSSGADASAAPAASGSGVADGEAEAEAGKKAMDQDQNDETEKTAEATGEGSTEAVKPEAGQEDAKAEANGTSAAKPEDKEAGAEAEAVDAKKTEEQPAAEAEVASTALVPASAVLTVNATEAAIAAAAAAVEQQGRRFKRQRRAFEIGLERFTFADRVEIDRIATTIYRTIQGIEDMYMRPACWENLVFVGNGCRLRGLRDNIMQTLTSRHLISPSTATIFTSELPSHLGTPSGTGAQTPTSSFAGGPGAPAPSSVNPLLQAATMSSLAGGPGSATGDGGHTHRFHSQTPTHIKQAVLPTYLGEWSKNGFEEAMFLGAQVAARLAFCVHNLDAQGLESQRLMYLSRIDYNELGPKGIRTHSLLG